MNQIIKFFPVKEETLMQIESKLNEIKNSEMYKEFNKKINMDKGKLKEYWDKLKELDAQTD